MAHKQGKFIRVITKIEYKDIPVTPDMKCGGIVNWIDPHGQKYATLGLSVYSYLPYRSKTLFHFCITDEAKSALGVPFHEILNRNNFIK